MKINTSYILAAILLLLIAVWFIINSAQADKTPSQMAARPLNQQAESAKPSVVVIRRRASERINTLTLYGRTEAAREVSVKAETAGIIVAAPAREGRAVKRGSVVCRQDIDARQAVLDQARASLRSVEVDLTAARTLADKGYQSATRVTAIEAQMDGARAAIKQAEIELDNVNMRAPFGGIWETQIAEVGDYLAPGQPCGLLVELDPLLVAAELTETQIGHVKRGQEAVIKLATGESLSGKVRLIESKANPATRTFRIEISVPNPELALRAGVTGTVKLNAGTTMAQKIPSKILTLNDLGEVGVRYLGYDDIVQFAQVKTIDEESNGIWVTGLPDDVRIIIKGQDYVSVGSNVIPTFGDAQ